VDRPTRIAGGGISGLATAVHLARRGLPVEVWDRRHGGGGRFAGGWQVLENGTTRLDALQELKAWGLAPRCEVVPVRQARFFDGRSSEHVVSSAEPYCYFVRRGPEAGCLDAWLRDEAVRAGARLVDGAAAPADTEVVATGPRVPDGVAREVVFRSDLTDTVAVLFDPALTPTGYAYLFCVGGHATFGVAMVRRLARLPEARRLAWERFRRLLGPFSVEVLHEGGQFMTFSMPTGLLGPDGRWYVGEAAGVQDYLYGLGIRLGLRSAALAAGGIAGQWDRDAFERGVRRRMLATVALRFLYERAGTGAFAAFCRRAAGRDFRELLLALQRPRPSLRLLARLVMPLWRDRSPEGRPPVATWSRRRER
jgi:flavin-dependent dehydrogenase